jgi:hypothetical protein
MPTLAADPELVAYCGLYCGECRRFTAGHCPGCRLNERAGWCKVRTCCLTNEYAGCAACSVHVDPMQCSRFNNIASRLFGFIFHSNRAACVQRIRKVGAGAFAREMTAQHRQSLPH